MAPVNGQKLIGVIAAVLLAGCDSNPDIKTASTPSHVALQQQTSSNAGQRNACWQSVTVISQPQRMQDDTPLTESDTANPRIGQTWDLIQRVIYTLSIGQGFVDMRNGHPQARKDWGNYTATNGC